MLSRERERVASMRQVQDLLLELAGILFFLNIFDPCIDYGAFGTRRVEGVKGTLKGQLGLFCVGQHF